MMQDSNTKKVLLTGVTSGVGHALARMMKDRGYYVIVTCRNEGQASILRAEKLFDSVVFADLGIIETVQSVPQQLRDQGVDQLDGFLHCAAISVASPVETVTMENVRHAFEVNVFGFLALMQGLIEPLRKARGRMVLTGSVAGFSVWPMLGIYGATKHAFEGLAHAARRELWPWGIQVSVVRPGGIKTRMLERHIVEMKDRLAALDGKDKQLYGKLYESYTQAMIDGWEAANSPEKIAGVVLKAFEARNPKASYGAGGDSKVLRLIDLLLPVGVMDFVTRKVFPVK
jgi:NAD(P)-dependent dehydrogenase (short-subunit alcohol dehydrogenase family)